MTIQELHRKRISNDYKEMCKLRESPMISWTAVKGKAPYIEEYLLTIKVNTYSGPDIPMKQCKVRITLPPQYPNVAPETRMEGTLVYHPNWYTSGRWCCGSYRPTESLGSYVIRLIQTLQYDKTVTNENSPANSDASAWYRSNKESGRFPSDKQPLPMLTGKPRFRRIG